VTKNRQTPKEVHILFIVGVRSIRSESVAVFFGNTLYKDTFTKEQSAVIQAAVYMAYEKLRVTKFAAYSQMITQLCNCCLAKNILVSVHVNL
jgi:hypothetical protein